MTEPAEGHELDERECLALLDLGVIGRVVYVDPEQHIRPVNYVRRGWEIYFRSDRPTPSAEIATFEVDHVDAVGHQGWSVVARGTARAKRVELADPDVVERLEPWAPGPKGWVISIRITEIQGRWVRGAAGGPGLDDRGYV